MAHPKDVLVLMPCGGEKLDTPARALDLYTGPLWQTLRHHLGVIPERNVFVLSALHGLRSALTVFAPYDRKMDGYRATAFKAVPVDQEPGRRSTLEPAPSVLAEVARWKYGRGEMNPWQAVIIAGASYYQDVMLHQVQALQALGAIDPDAELLFVAGNGAGIGTQRKRLGEALGRFQPQPLTERGGQTKAPEAAVEMIERLRDDVLLTAELHGQDAIVVRQERNGALVASFWEDVEPAVKFAELDTTGAPLVVLAKRPRTSGKPGWPLRAWRNFVQG